MRAAWLIAVKDLKLRLRDRSVFIIGIVAPLALATVFNFVFGDALDPQTGIQPSYGLVDLDEGPIAAQFAGMLDGMTSGGFGSYETIATEAEARERVEDDLDAAFVLAEGFSESVTSGGATSITIIGNVGSPTLGRVAESIAGRFAANLETGRLTFVAAQQLGTQTAPEELAAQAGAAEPFVIETSEAAGRQLDTGTYFMAGMAVFFLFFTIQFGVTSLLDERRDGTLGRLLAAPIGRNTILLGKALASLVVGVISMTVLIGAAALLMGAQWGHPLGVGLLVVSGVLAAIGIMGVVATVSRTPEGAGNLGSVVAVVLGFLGGTFIPISSGGGVLDALSRMTPHYWFLHGLAELTNDAPWTAAVGPSLAILAFALVTGAAAVVGLGRRLSL